MRAIRQHTTGGPDVLRLEDVPDPTPSAGEVRIRVAVAGVHLLDASLRAGEEGPFGRLTLPMTPGREVAGVVDAVGPDVDRGWVGRRVVAHLGAAHGGYAELAVVAAQRAYPIPDGLGDAAAVAAIGTGRTAVGILDLADLTPDDVVVVTSAAGGLGVLLVQEAHAAGAEVVAIAGGPDKLARVAGYGPATLVDRSAPDWAAALDRASRPTVVFDAVGGPVGRAAHARLASGGRLVRYGWTSGEQNDYDRHDVRVVDVLGPAMVARRGSLEALEAEALARAADGRRVPVVVDRFALADAAGAHRALESGATVGKVVLVTGSGDESVTR